MMIEVKLSRPSEVVSVDEEIITVTGWDLGFITPGRPLHVLHVEPGAEIAAHGVRSNDLLVGIDGRGVASIAKEDVAKLLQVATRLNFERPAEAPAEPVDVVMEPVDARPPPAVAEPPATAMTLPDVPTEAEPELSPATAAAAAAAAAVAAVAAAVAEPVGVAEAAAPGAEAAAPSQLPAGSVVGVPAPRGHALRTGMQVRLKGFESEAMNGTRGRLGRFSEKQGFWEVFLESTASVKAKAVRPQNLELAPEEEEMQDAVVQQEQATRAAQPSAPTPGAASGSSQTNGASGIPAPRREVAEGLPLDHDGDAWVELLRDAYMRQLRSDNEYPEPPPYDRANQFAANSFPIPEGKFPAQALRMQAQMLHRAANGEGPRPGRRRGMPPMAVPRFLFPVFGQPPAWGRGL